MLIPKRSLISTSDKTGVVEFARGLSAKGIEIISTGGTAKVIGDAGIKVKAIDDVTGFPEMLEGRLKTLHPNVFGGILAKRTDDHLGQIKAHSIEPIDIVVVNLYPFAKTIAKPDVKIEDAIENIDIGGPSLIRAAAKNHESVAVLTSSRQYQPFLDELDKGGISDDTLKQLAVDAFAHTAQYDSMIFHFFNDKYAGKKFPETYQISLKKIQELRYGENPHQEAAFYSELTSPEPSITSAKQLHGKALSYNNILDTNDALELVKSFEEPAASVIKHTNPCGIACGATIEEAYEKAFLADTLSAFGGVVAMNRPLSKEIAETMSKVFLEVVIAPSFEKEAFDILSKKKNIRLLELGELSKPRKDLLDFRKVVGGMLVQDLDRKELEPEKFKVVTKRQPTDEEMIGLKFAWQVTKHVKSNSIVLAKGKEAVGIGAGQMSRVVAVKLAAEKAGDNAKGSVMASDAFFPFRDGVDEAGKAGVTAVIHPGGSIRDQESIDAANEYGMAMVFCGLRTFKH